MASIVNLPNKHYWVQYKAPNGRRQTVRLGSVSPQAAMETKLRIERLVACQTTGDPPDPTTSAWVKALGDKLRKRLATLGLIPKTETVMLQRLVDDFLKSLSLKPSTVCNITHACNGLLAFFGGKKLLNDITEADAKTFRAWLLREGGAKGKPLASTTVSRRCRRAKQVFQYALDKRWIDKSPLAALKGGNEVNRERDFYVSVELIESVLSETPKADMRAIIALARFGALRCPSEILPLKWGQINWDKETILVKSPKTAHHEEGASRTVPLFPEVRESLKVLWDEAPEGEILLFPKRQVTGTALSNELRRACWAAGHALWAKPWQNMRATRETELFQEFPVHVVANWLGHSPNIAIKHYTQVVKEHQAKAVNLRQTVLHPQNNLSKKRSTQNGNREKAFLSISPKKTKNSEK